MTNPEKTNPLVKGYFDSFKKERTKLSPNTGDTSNQPELGLRRKHYTQIFETHYQDFRKSCAAELLTSNSSWDLLLKHTAWSDAWVIFTWYYVIEERDLLVSEFVEIGQQKLSYLGSSIIQIENRIKELKGYLAPLEDQTSDPDPAEYAYYRQNLAASISKLEKAIMEYDVLKEVVPILPSVKIDIDHITNHILIFARGGFGRGELTFSSDLDIGYCCDRSSLSVIDLVFSQELIKRMEELYHNISWSIASQYFELDEDLSRFAKPDMMHTIPSILEARPIFGCEKKLLALKYSIREVCTEEQLVLFFQEQMEKLIPDKQHEIFHIKNGFGGIRHLQYSLWMAMVVFSLSQGVSRFVLDELRKRGIISQSKLGHLQYALEFYFDLRNFLGLFEFYEKNLIEIELDGLPKRDNSKNDFLDDPSCIAYLKLKERFITVDFMDRSRLHSINVVSKAASLIVNQLLDRTVEERLNGFSVVRHLGNKQIIEFKPMLVSSTTSWNIQLKAKQSEQLKQLTHALKECLFFLDLAFLFELFTYIAKTGNPLNEKLVVKFSAIIPDIYQLDTKDKSSLIKNFIYLLFQQPHASIAVGQMMEIASPLSYHGESQTLLGAFLPVSNQMRYLLRNLEVHEYPLCVHSLKALKEVEAQIIKSKNTDPELWKFIGEKDIFALKWSTFFHDIGKINPYKNHEELGPVICSEMLQRLGWNKGSELMELIRFLVRHHQSVVRFSKLSSFLDVGILKFFELAQRSPRKVLLLYLVNLCDLKSVSSAMSRKTGSLTKFYNRTLNILEEFKSEQSEGSLNEMVNNYLDRKIGEIRFQVLLEILLQQCCNKSLEKIILTPLSNTRPDELKKIVKVQKELKRDLHFIELGELDSKTLENYRNRAKQSINKTLSIKTIQYLAAPFARNCDWFFTALPNRFLLSFTPEVLVPQLFDFMEYNKSNLHFSLIEGGKDEYDTLLFCAREDQKVHAKIAYALGRMGMNIENGKVNTVEYRARKKGVVGFFQVSNEMTKKITKISELETLLDNLSLPPLTFSQNQVVKDSNIQLTSYKENKKGYLVKELENDQYVRKREGFTAIKLTFFDKPFCYFKIMQAFNKLGIIPQQITVTTIGKQIVDYFYLPEKEFKKVGQKMIQIELNRHLKAIL